jgi:class 3 adenylate cyclase
MPTEQKKLEASLAALEAQRHLLGDAVVDAALGAMRDRLHALQSIAPHTTQSLRQVSILFLDVVGSTTLAQRLDPEEVSAVMDGALSRGTAIVEVHRGRALQYAGDNILAAFGADEAAEDDAERAVRCGLALLALGQTIGTEVLRAHGYSGCNFRVGIHTGAVLLGGGVDDDASIRGQAVNIAARMSRLHRSEV